MNITRLTDVELLSTSLFICASSDFLEIQLQRAKQDPMSRDQGRIKEIKEKHVVAETANWQSTFSPRIKSRYAIMLACDAHHYKPAMAGYYRDNGSLIAFRGNMTETATIKDHEIRWNRKR